MKPSLYVRCQSPLTFTSSLVNIILTFQIRSPVASFPSTRLALRLPSLGFHFSPSRYHRLMQIAKIFQGKDAEIPDLARPWDQADLGGWLYHLTWKVITPLCSFVWLRLTHDTIDIVYSFYFLGL